MIRTVYGNDMVYPVCETAKLFAGLTGTKTFSVNHIRLIELLGYVIEFVPYRGQS